MSGGLVFYIFTPIGIIPSAAPRQRRFFLCQKMTNYTIQQVKDLSDSQFLDTIRQWPMASQWVHSSAFDYALSRLTHMNGARYATTGSTKAFTNSIR